MFHHCRICVADFKEGRPKSPPHPWAAPKKPILNRVKCNHSHLKIKLVRIVKNQFLSILLLGHFIIAGLSRYLKVWQRYFTPFNRKYVWVSQESPSLKNVVVSCRTNTLFTGYPMDIAVYIDNIGFCLIGKSSSNYVFICGLVRRDERWSVKRVLIKNVNNNRIWKHLCLKHDFCFIDQSNGWKFLLAILTLLLFLKILYI